MTTNYNVDPNKKGTNGWGAPFSDTIYSATLKAATDTVLAVPLTSAMGTPTAKQFNKFLAVVTVDPNATTAVYIALNATAAVPAGIGFAATTSEIVPNNYICKYVKSTDVIHFISAGTPSITVSFYAIQE